MKKRKIKVDADDTANASPKQNPVAKFAGRFNKAKVIDDKTAYRRKEKHVKQEQEASPSASK
ncbi:MAG: hypothetical protein FJ190_11025 [Gammaproteobacteria bacterium]|nr:hypothetical protein [Gammaproteobacteria bacterium]